MKQKIDFKNVFQKWFYKKKYRKFFSLRCVKFLGKRSANFSNFQTTRIYFFFTLGASDNKELSQKFQST